MVDGDGELSGRLDAYAHSISRQSMSRNQVIVQLPVEETTSLDDLVAIEESLIKAFTQRNPFAEVDGHDIGQRRFNIFITPTGSWGPVLERVHASLKLRGVLHVAKVAKRLKKSGRLAVVWPEPFNGTFEL